MISDDTVTWERIQPFGSPEGAIFGTLAGLLAALVLGAAGVLPLWACALAVAGCAAVGGGLGHVVRRHSINQVVFRGESVHLESRTTSRTVFVSDLREVLVQHYGQVPDYSNTQLTLDWTPGTAHPPRRRHRIEVPNKFDPTLGDRLERVLGPHVRVEQEWMALRQPSQGPGGP